jgi:hypothetical protein
LNHILWVRHGGQGFHGTLDPTSWCALGPAKPLLLGLALVNVNANSYEFSNPYLAQGGRIENLTMVQEGYFNSEKDVQAGIGITTYNRDVAVIGGAYIAPDYSLPSKTAGAVGLDSAGPNTSVEDFRVVGRVDERDGVKYPNIKIHDGVVRNCIADKIRITGPGPIENCRPNSNQTPIIGVIRTDVALAGADIGPAGDPLERGSTTLKEGGVIEVVAGGSSNGLTPTGDADRVHFSYVEVTGDFDVSVCVSRLDPVSAYSQAGLMLRGSLDPASRSIRLVELPAGPTRDGEMGANRYHFMNRDIRGGSLDIWYACQNSWNPESNLLPNTWLRLTRRGNIFTAYRGSHGFFLNAFSQIAVTNPYPDRVYVGLITTSENNAPGMSTVAHYHDYRLIDLAPIKDHVVTEGSLLTLTVPVIEYDSGQALTFSLGGNPPLGAAIDSNTGVFTWTPAHMIKRQAPTRSRSS